MNYLGNRISTHFETHFGLDQNQLILKRKLEELNGIKEDNESIKSIELQPRKKLKKAVEIWFQSVERINDEILNLENKVRETNVVSVSRASLGAEVLARTEEVKDLIEQGKCFNGLVIDDPQWIGLALSTTTLYGEAPKKVMEEIWAYLMDDGFSKIGVWGMGGVGKTTIMKLINNQLLEETKKFNIVIWITVSKELNIARLQNGIARAMKESLSKEDDETMRAGMLYEMLARKGKYVLILDDVWEWDTFALEKVGIPEPFNGSKIVITTRSMNVCQHFGAKEVRLHTLSEEDAWNLFLHKVGEDVSGHPDVLPIVKSVAKECDGLPLAIVTIASSMKGVRDVREWRNAHNELRRCVNSVNGLDEKIFQQLQFSYDHLENGKVKYCFLYLALYPEDWAVGKDELIEKWIDEGFVEEMDNMEAELDKGHTIMNKLINNCLFETLKDWRGRTSVKLHDLMRDLALRITSARPRIFLAKAGMKLRQIPALQEWTADLERVSLMENWGLRIPSNMSPPNCGMLTTLLLGSCCIDSIPENFFEHMRGLKVLDLSMNAIRSVPESIQNLSHLTILLLQDCRLLERVPSLSNFQALKKLDISSTGLYNLPDGLERLVNLRHLGIGYTKISKVADGLIANLTSLQYLKIFNLRGVNSCINGEEVGGLEELEYFKGRFYDLKGLNDYVQLQAFSGRTRRPSEYFIFVGDEPDDFVDSMFGKERFIGITGQSIPVAGVKIPPDVKTLGFDKCIAELSYSSYEHREAFFSHFITPMPHDIFPCLSRIEVRRCTKIKKLFSFNWIKQNLQNVSDLTVIGCDDIEEIIASESESESNAEERGRGTATIKFTLLRLKCLHLGDLPRLKSICSANRAMKCDSLEEIIIRSCPKLKRMPLYLPLNDNGQPSAPPYLNRIEIDENGWETMEWEHPNAKSLLQPFLHLR